MFIKLGETLHDVLCLLQFVDEQVEVAGGEREADWLTTPSRGVGSFVLQSVDGGSGPLTLDHLLALFAHGGVLTVSVFTPFTAGGWGGDEVEVGFNCRQQGSQESATN